MARFIVMTDYRPTTAQVRAWQRRQLRSVLWKSLKACSRAVQEAASFEIKVRVSELDSMKARLNEVLSSATHAEEEDK